MKTLKQLTLEAVQITNQIVDVDGELTQETEAALDQNAQDLSLKVDAYTFVLDRIDAEIDIWKEHKQQADSVIRRLDAARERLRDGLKVAASTQPENRIEGDYARVTVSPSKGLLVVNDSELPDTFCRVVTTLEPDKERIRQALEEGQTVRGAFIKPGLTLRITKGPKRIK